MIITLDGQAYTLRPTFAALYALEEQLGCGLITLAKEVAAGQFTLKQVEAILAAGIKGAGGQVPRNLGELVLQQGIAAFAAILAQFLRLALTGDDSAGKACAASDSPGPS